MVTALSVCVADDDQTDQELFGHYLQSAFPRVRVRYESNAKALQAACEQEKFDCVLLDYHMPGDDGLECASQLRATHPYLPIIMSTNFGDEMLATRAMHCGASEYIPKSRVTPQSLRRAIENAVQLTEQLRVIDEQRSELEHFAHALAHDFRQPIRQILTFTSLVTEALETRSTETVPQYMGFLNNAAQRLGELVDVLSQYSLLHEAPELNDVDMEHVISNVAFAVAPYVKERDGMLITQSAPPVWGNAALMNQVLQNLVINGIKYNKSAIPCVTIESETSAYNCTIKVTDNGIGIDPKHHAEIFKPLSRLHAASEFTGTGLGLALARKALAHQGGAIWLESAPGKGSTFFVKLPLARNKPPPATDSTDSTERLPS